MIRAIRDIVDFVEVGKLPGFVGLVPALNAQALRVASLKLLGWLKSRAKHSAGRSLELNPEFGWCANLQMMISASDELAHTFEFSGSRLDFADDVPAQDRREIESFVDQHFHPRLMT